VKKYKIALILVAVGAVAFSLINASWIAGPPPGQLILVAHRGIAQPVDRAAAGASCSARHVRAAGHSFIENTLFSMQNAVRLGARGLAMDVRASADGHAMIHRDEDLSCRTDGIGRISERPLSYLRTLDIGHGYSPDGGATFPLRGRGVGGMLTAEEAIQGFPTMILLFTLSTPRDAEALVAAFGRAGVPIGDSHGFAGAPAALARLRQLTPAGWVLDPEVGAQCLSAYRSWGWAGLVPGVCRGAVVSIPRRGEWTLWGWPYRFMRRMSEAGARLFVAGDGDGALVGLEQPEQLGEVPRGYAGMLLIEDMHGVGRSLDR
jgi:glycerophosphoryl diester phosphodiesterase